MKRWLQLRELKTWETVLLYLSGLSLVFFIMMNWRLEYDYGWHIAAGDYIRAHGVPGRDVFSYVAQNFVWINHEWLHDVGLSWLNQVGGYALISVVFSVLWAAAILVASRRLMFPILLLAAEAVLPFAAARPAVWAFLFFGVAQRVLEAPKRWQWTVIPALALVWTNLHGSFPLLLVMLAASWYVRRDRSTGLLLAVCAGLTLVNPYGWHLYTEVFRTVFDARLGGYIQEWQSLRLPALSIVFAAGYLVLWWEYEPRRRLVSWPFGLLAAALMRARYLPLFVSAAIRGFEENAHRLVVGMKEGKRQRSLAMWVIFCGLAGGVAQNTWFASRILGHDNEFQMPRAAAEYLAVHRCSGNMFNDYDFGGYLIWKDPGVKVYIDGRMPSWRDAQGRRYLDAYRQVIRDDGFRREEFQRYGIRCVVAGAPGGGQASAGLVPKLAGEGWRVAADDEVGVLLLAPKAKQ